MPHLQQGSKVIGKKALQTGVNVAQDVLDGGDIKKAIRTQAKQSLGLSAQNSLQGQSGAGKKALKRKAQEAKISSPPGKKAKTSPQQKKPTSSVHHESREFTKSELDLFTIPAT